MLLGLVEQLDERLYDEERLVVLQRLRQVCFLGVWNGDRSVHGEGSEVFLFFLDLISRLIGVLLLDLFEFFIVLDE